MPIEIHTEQPVDLERLPFEAVERKGIGHPDTLCDAIAELASRRYSSYVLDLTDRLPHHYFDKVVLMGGAADMELGRGELVQPYRVLFAGKVTRRIGHLAIPVADIIAAAAREVLTGILQNFDPDRDLVVLDELRDYQGPSKRRPRYQPESAEVLPGLTHPGKVSNDVNLCTGYAPLTRCERLVLSAEKYVNSSEYKGRYPFSGTDVKVAGVRTGDRLHLTVNMPFIAPRVSSMHEYQELSRLLASDLRTYCDSAGFADAGITFNPQDVSGLPYLTVTGSVADTGDVGVVGRGNRANGLITPMRPMSIEAVSGKSPIDNTGKIYGVLAPRLAAKIQETTGHPNAVTIVTFRDRPLDDPAHLMISVADRPSDADSARIRELAAEALRLAPDLTRELVLEGVVSW